MLKSRGFSLVELLTVIAIIALLAAIIFPVMSTVKAKARQQGCISQLHELAMRADMYKKDNGRYPLTLGPQYRGTTVPINTIRAGTTGPGGEDPGLFIRGYIDNYRMFHCPSDISDNMVNGVTYGCDASNGKTVNAYTFSSYDFFAGAPDFFTGIRYAYRWAAYSGGAFVTLLPTASTPGPYPRGTTDTPELQQQDYQRQLCWRNPPSDTVLTWCSYHADSPEGTNPVGMTVFVFVDGHTTTIPANVAQSCRWRVRLK